VLGSNDSQLAASVGDLTTNVGFRVPRAAINAQNEIDVAHFWSFHSVGANFLFADGSVHFLNYSVPPVTFAALCTMNVGEVIGNY
jgi:prepilin-type processing-associated H-X9-DG protein